MALPFKNCTLHTLLNLYSTLHDKTFSEDLKLREYYLRRLGVLNVQISELLDVCKCYPYECEFCAGKLKCDKCKDFDRCNSMLLTLKEVDEQVI